MRTPRRHFLFGSLAAVAGGLAPKPSRSASETVVLGFMGVRGRGRDLIKYFAKRSDVEIAYLADVDSRLLAERAAEVESLRGHRPKTVQDFRRVLDDKSVDALVIATPDHWHALATIWACQAGKDVYVEKPTSHSIWESRKMVEAARKHDRVVQVGAQCRSAPYMTAALEYLQSGKLGDVHFVKVFNSKPRSTIGNLPDKPVPAGVDYDMWLGPAPMRPFNENHFHYAWHWFWNYSGGDLINDGVHQLDLARWCIGRKHPRSVYSTGGIHFFKDAQETPDTQIVTWDYDGLTMALRADALDSVPAEDAVQSPRSRRVTQMALQRYPRRDLRHQAVDDARPARRRLGSVRRRLQVRGPSLRTTVQRTTRGQLLGLHPQPSEAQRRYRRAPLLDLALSLRQHRLPPGPQAGDRPRDRGVRGR